MFLKRKRITGKHALVTGGSKGIGFEISKALLEHGCHVSICARSKEDLNEARDLLENISADNTKIHCFVADVADTKQVQEACREAEQTIGPIDILVCNAGLSIPKLCIETSIEEYHRQMDVNFLGVVRTVKAVLPGMVERGTGHICLVSSVLGVLGFAGYSSYAPSKWAVRGFADCLHNELQGTGITLSVAYPPDTDTPGFATETELKSDLCKTVNAALGSETFSAEKVGRSIVSQMLAGKYHITPPDLGSTMLISSMTSLSPKAIPLLLGIILAPILHIVSSIVASIGNKAARKYNTKHGYGSEALQS